MKSKSETRTSPGVMPGGGESSAVVADETESSSMDAVESK